MLKDLKSSVWFALGSEVACERQTFSLAHRRWGTFREEEPQRQKFHTDDVNHCLHNKSGSHGVPNANLFNFMFPLVDFGKTLCSSANELQQNSNAIPREYYIPQILTVLLEIHRVYFWPLQPFVFCLSFVNNSQNNETTPPTNCLFCPESEQSLRHQYGISVAESQTFLLAKRPSDYYILRKLHKSKKSG